MSEATPVDDRGRFTVKPAFRDFLGDRVIQILTPDGLLLVPVKGKLARGSLGPSVAVNGDELYWQDEARRRPQDDRAR